MAFQIVHWGVCFQTAVQDQTTYSYVSSSAQGVPELFVSRLLKGTCRLGHGPRTGSVRNFSLYLCSCNLTWQNLIERCSYGLVNAVLCHSDPLRTEAHAFPDARNVACGGPWWVPPQGLPLVKSSWLTQVHSPFPGNNLHLMTYQCRIQSIDTFPQFEYHCRATADSERPGGWLSPLC